MSVYVLGELFRAGCKKDTQAEGDGNTPLHVCGMNGHEPLVKAIMRHVEHTAVPNHKGYTPAVAAVLSGHPDIGYKIYVQVSHLGIDIYISLPRSSLCSTIPFCSFVCNWYISVRQNYRCFHFVVDLLFTEFVKEESVPDRNGVYITPPLPFLFTCDSE
tara:strand:- start:1583 stop:2059 length:477 start_codon:yes stop_codon:yes gene_type:complete